MDVPPADPNPTPKAAPAGPAGPPSEKSRPLDPATLAVPLERLRWRCDPESLGFDCVTEVPQTQGIIGQERALEAIRLGMSIRSRGFNVFVTGPPGSGRGTTVRHLLESVDSGRGAPPDVVFVHDFRNPDSPRNLTLAAGRGRTLRRALEDAIAAMRRGIAGFYESDAYKKRAQEVVERHQLLEKEAVRELETKAKAEHFALVQVQLGPYTKPDVAPLIGGEATPLEKIEELVGEGKFSAGDYEKLRAKQTELRGLLETAFKRSRELKRSLRDELAALDLEFAGPIVDEALHDARTVSADPELQGHLDSVRAEVLKDLSRFVDRENEQGELPPKLPLEDDPRYRPFLVNLLVDNEGRTTAPMVFETTPNQRNLFGTIERVVDRGGHWRSDFLHIKAGSVLRANGGFLVFDLTDAAQDTGVWAALKRTLRHQQVDIQSFDPLFLVSTSALKPEPIPVDVRVIVLGDSYSYQYLHGLDPDFRKIFKVKAEFDTVMPRNREGIERYVRFMRNVSAEESLRCPDKTGAAALIEEGARMAAQEEKLSTRFSELADLLREASWRAEQAGAERVDAAIFEQTLEARARRFRLPEEKMQEMIEDDTIRIETAGGVIGQVNALTVFDLGDHRFGKPTRITAQTSLGQGGILSIEREAELSGRTFNKAMLILDGFFRARFGQDFPLSVNASIAFEQSYGEVEGDSASVAEILALLSSLSEVPLRQEFAVTGSADQRGQVQPIGGVNEKIEGFFDVCAARGLTGREGVVIPRRDVGELMLRHEVVEAVRDARFHVFAVDTVEQAIELMTGVAAGRQGEDGLYEEGTVFGRTQDRLHFYAERMKEFGKPEGPPGEGPADGPAHANPTPAPPPSAGEGEAQNRYHSGAVGVAPKPRRKRLRSAD